MELGCSWDCLGIMDMGQGPRPGWYCCCACLFWFLFFSVCAACGIKTCGKTGFEGRAWRRPSVILNRHDKFSSSTLTGFRSWCLYYTSVKIAIYGKASHHKYTPHRGLYLQRRDKNRQDPKTRNLLPKLHTI